MKFFKLSKKAVPRGAIFKPLKNVKVPESSVISRETLEVDGTTITIVKIKLEKPIPPAK